MSEEQASLLTEIMRRIAHGQGTFSKSYILSLLEIIHEQSASLEMWAVNADEAAKRAGEREARITSLEERLSLCEEED